MYDRFPLNIVSRELNDSKSAHFSVVVSLLTKYSSVLTNLFFFM